MKGGDLDSKDIIYIVFSKNIINYSNEVLDLHSDTQEQYPTLKTHVFKKKKNRFTVRQQSHLVEMVMYFRENKSHDISGFVS